MPITPEELTRRIHAVTPFIATLGIEVVAAGGGKAETRLPMRADLTQDLGHPHGGVIGAIADVTANLALREPSVTIEYKLNFLKGARAETLIGRGEVIRAGRSVAVSEARIYALDEGEETLVAVCLATLAPMYRDSEGKATARPDG